MRIFNISVWCDFLVDRYYFDQVSIAFPSYTQTQRSGQNIVNAQSHIMFLADMALISYLNCNLLKKNLF